MTTATTTMSASDELAQLRAENEKLRAKVKTTIRPLTFKVATKSRAFSIYGTGRFPLTVFPSNMLRILDKAPEIRAFIEAHKGELAWKDEPEVTE
jgi:hypothetical protein